MIVSGLDVELCFALRRSMKPRSDTQRVQTCRVINRDRKSNDNNDIFKYFL